MIGVVEVFKSHVNFGGAHDAEFYPADLTNLDDGLELFLMLCFWRIVRLL